MNSLFFIICLLAAAAACAFVFLRKKGRASALPLLVALLAVSLLAGCGSAAGTPQDTPSSDAAAPTYNIRFYFRDNLLQTQELAAGQPPAKLELSLPGMLFAGWQDAAGNTVQPERIPAAADADYRAVIYPVLENHVPYLFPDENGFLYPDAPMTSKAMGEALRALAAPEAVAYLPALPADETAFTPDAFRETLLALFPAAQVDGACAGFESDALISRRAAAVILNRLLGRSGSEVVTLRREALLPPDVSSDTPDDLELLEASVSHTVDAWGEAWSGCAIPPCYAPGFLRLDGRLYCIRENGSMLRDGELDGFAFGPDGVYTSGDAELDDYVTEILRDIVRADPGADELDHLLAAYRYARDSFTYLRKPLLDFGATGWETESALDMLRTRHGSCYGYAAVFWALARGLGYDAKAYSGTITQQPHGWVEITLDGEEYLCDPELEMAARERGQHTNDDRFMMTKAKALFYGVYSR